MKRLIPVLCAALVASAATVGALALPALGRDGSDEPRVERLPLPGLDGERRAELEKFEACMKEQGFELGRETRVRITPDGVTVNGKKVDADEFRAAQKKCGGPPFGPLGRRPELGRLRECLGDVEPRRRDDTTLEGVLPAPEAA